MGKKCEIWKKQVIVSLFEANHKAEQMRMGLSPQNGCNPPCPQAWPAQAERGCGICPGISVSLVPSSSCAPCSCKGRILHTLLLTQPTSWPCFWLWAPRSPLCLSCCHL